MNINDNLYCNFLEILDRYFSSKKFSNKLKNVQEIDSKHYSKKVNIREIIQIIHEYKEKKIDELNVKNVRVFLDGIPEVVFQLMLESVRKNFNLDICIHDFCYGQNLLIYNEINNICHDLNIENKINLINMISDKEILKSVDNFDKNIIIGDPNLYNNLSKSSEKFELNSYGIIEIYSDCDDFDIIKEKIFDVCEYNQYFIEDYSDFDFDDAVKFINKEGCKFASIILSRDENKIQIFKKEITSKYIVTNENPFKKIKFDINL